MDEVDELEELEELDELDDKDDELEETVLFGSNASSFLQEKYGRLINKAAAIKNLEILSMIYPW